MLKEGKKDPIRKGRKGEGLDCGSSPGVTAERLKGSSCLERDAERRKERPNKERKGRGRVGLQKLSRSNRFFLGWVARGRWLRVTGAGGSLTLLFFWEFFFHSFHFMPFRTG